MSFKMINVGIADIKVSTTPDILRTILGSCVGICMYDNENKTGGMAHIMLPEYRKKSTSKMKYADTAIPILIQKMINAGADKKNLVSKIVGGAKMFDVSDESIMNEIGRQNVQKVKEVLHELSIPILGEDVFGGSGRTIDFYLESGEVKIKSMGKEVKVL